MPIGSKDLIVDNLDKIEDSLLVEELKKAKEELFNLRFQSATGQLESHGRLRAVKRDIARIYTIIRERELGIRAVPVAAAAAAPKAKKGVRSIPRRRVVSVDKSPSGRERHDEKITVYLSPDELFDLDQARLTLRGDLGLAVDRGRIVRESIAVIIADLEQKGDQSILARRLRGI